MKLTVPAYVFLCLVLGGSNRGIWLSAILQVIAAVLIGFVALTAKEEKLANPCRLLLGLVIATVLLVLLQLVPLPPQLWMIFHGREPIREGYEALGLALPWLPISLTPHATLNAAFFALPFSAVLLIMIVGRRTEPGWTVAALVLGTFLSVVLGAVQTGDESWKIYSITNTGAVGFFANRNFFGTLLVVNIPFAVALMGSGRLASQSAGLPFKIVGAAYLLTTFIGIVLNQSLAAGLIAIPVSVASLAILPVRFSWKWYAAAIGALGAIAVAFLLMSGFLGSEMIGSDTVSIQTRAAIWSQTLKILSDTFPFGTGLGSFREIYAFYENPAAVDRWYVNNAHNDFLELVLETGLPGVLLIGSFLVWWLLQTKKVWRSPHVNLVARAATIASAAVLAHSIVDYPLRTAAISAIFGFCVGAIATFDRSSDRSEHPAERHTRHVRIA